MPIQNIDNYVMPGRSQEASIHRTAETNKVPMEQEFLTQEVRGNVDKKLNRTNKADDVELSEDAFDARKKGSNHYFKQDKKKKKKKDEPDATLKWKGDIGGSIDIKL